MVTSSGAWRITLVTAANAHTPLLVCRGGEEADKQGALQVLFV